MIEHLEVLDNLIVGRVTPHIYAFSTNTVPNYLKVGDTYRPVSTRLHEWRLYFPDLTKDFEDKASVTGDVYFRDFAVHQFLEQDLKKVRLLPEEIEEGIYYSKEFFREAKPEDVKQAIQDITSSYEQNSGKYAFYDASRRLPEEYHYERGASWALRPNQEAAVEAFQKAIQAGRHKLLMYAVMRFGKSFTSLCCALAMEAKLVLVVSAKADVAEEWKKTVESAGNFKDYVFVDSRALSGSERILEETLENGKRAVIFLTLQDLQGNAIKEKHQEIFEHRLDLVIVDETHFGARAASYGKVLADVDHEDDDDAVSLDDADEVLKQLHAKIQLHLSGTPYRILMGSEFEPKDIIAFVQFTDIVNEQKAWDAAHLADDETNEWDNPYFGFPEMIRFAFHPNESSRKKMEELQKQGVSAAMSALFKPLSTKKDIKTNAHKKFRFEQEITELLRVIDGTKEDENLLGFLDYDKLKEGKMCRHLVMVLPYRASCDAMEALIDKHKDEFKNLGNYRIINISGVDGSKNYKRPSDVKRLIRECESEDQKTLTLTVNRMLTGSTVEQWDTMLYFKDTASPQEYDQSIFRLQNQYTRELRDEEGHVIKENLKPQTLLVDFDPARLFRMQEQKALIYNANVEKGGNAKLKARIEEELRISPVVLLNHGKIHQIEATDILEVISAYHNNRSVNDEVIEIPVDMGLLDDPRFKALIERQGEFGSKQGMTLSPASGEGDYLDVPDVPVVGNAQTPVPDSDGDEQEDETTPSTSTTDEDKEEQKLAKKIQTFYQRILFYAFLTPVQVNSVQDILDTLDDGPNPRIADNLSINRAMLEALLERMNPFMLSKLDYKVQNISTLAHDESLSPVERATTSLAKFNRMSDSEVITPAKVSHDMVALLPVEGIRTIMAGNQNFLDMGGKAGEYPLALFRLLTEELGYTLEEVKDRIYSIPTSSIAYEFTRRFYETLGLNTQNIARGFNAYDLLKIKDEKGEMDYEKAAMLLQQMKPFETITLAEALEKGADTVEFGAVVGNPPYNELDGGAQSSSQPIYQHFVNISSQIKPFYLTMIIPTRWFAGGKGLHIFREFMLNNIFIKVMHDFLSPEEIFPGTNNRGGICYFLMDKSWNAEIDHVLFVTHKNGEVINYSQRRLKTAGVDILVRDAEASTILEKINIGQSDETARIENHISSLRPFGFRGYFVNDANYKSSQSGMNDPILCIGKGRREGFVERALIQKNRNWIDKWKVFIPRANNIATELNDDNLNAFVAGPKTICTESYLCCYGEDNLSEEEANNLVKYMSTRFFRYLHSLAKSSQDSSAKTFRFIPVQDYSKESDINWSCELTQLDNQLFEKYGLDDAERAHIRNSIKTM